MKKTKLLVILLVVAILTQACDGPALCQVNRKGSDPMSLIMGKFGR